MFKKKDFFIGLLLGFITGTFLTIVLWNYGYIKKDELNNIIVTTEIKEKKSPEF